MLRSHISATVDSDLLEEVNRFGQEEHRTRSQIFELALEQYLEERTKRDDEIVTSSGSFAGEFSREETYVR